MRKYKPYTYDWWFRYQNPNTLDEIKRIVPWLFVKWWDTPDNLCEWYIVFWENNSLWDTYWGRFSEAVEWLEEVLEYYSDFIWNELLWIKYETNPTKNKRG